MKMMIFVISFLFITASFAQDLTLEERVSNLEQQMLDLPNYVENNCELVLDYAGSNTIGCFDSVVSSVRTDLRRIGNNIYVTNWLECKKYRLVCR